MAAAAFDDSSFVPSSVFLGPIKDFMFTTREGKTGYYREAPPWQHGDPPQLPLAPLSLEIADLISPSASNGSGNSLRNFTTFFFFFFFFLKKNFHHFFFF